MTISQTRHSFAAPDCDTPGCNDAQPENPMSFLRALLPWFRPRTGTEPDPFDRHLSMIENARPAPRQALFRNRRRPPEA